jgi:hypothetical protein
MTNKRRIIIILVSVFGGTVLSFLVFKLRRGGGALTTQDSNMLLTNFIFSIAIILGIGFMFLWNKKNNI